MTEDKERIQSLLDDFILRNEEEIGRVSSENPMLLKSVMDVVDLLSKKYGMGTSETAQKIEEIKEKVQPVEEQKPAKKSRLYFKEGDVFRHASDPNTFYKIELVTDETVMFRQLSTPSEKFTFETKDVQENFRNGTWNNLGNKPFLERKPIEAEPEKKKVIVPFEEGDEFYHVDNKNYKYKIVEIDDEDVYVQLPNQSGRVHYDLNEAISLVNDGTWVMIPKYTRVMTPEEKIENVSEIKEEETEEVTLDDLKLAIKNLKPLAEFDEEVKLEIERLKQRMKDLKKKKS
jgi:hypothetical protein